MATGTVNDSLCCFHCETFLVHATFKEVSWRTVTAIIGGGGVGGRGEEVERTILVLARSTESSSSFFSPFSPLFRFFPPLENWKRETMILFFFFLQLDFATPPRGFFVEISSSNYGRRNEWERNCEGCDLMRSGERYGARKLGGARLDISVAICGELIKRGECNLDMRQYEICIRYYIGGCEERDFEEDSLELVDILIRLILWINHPRCPPSRNLFSNFLWIKKKGDFFFFLSIKIAHVFCVYSSTVTNILMIGTGTIDHTRSGASTSASFSTHTASWCLWQALKKRKAMLE